MALYHVRQGHERLGQPLIDYNIAGYLTPLTGITKAARDETKSVERAWADRDCIICLPRDRCIGPMLCITSNVGADMNKMYTRASTSTAQGLDCNCQPSPTSHLNDKSDPHETCMRSSLPHQCDKLMMQQMYAVFGCRFIPAKSFTPKLLLTRCPELIHPR